MKQCIFIGLIFLTLISSAQNFPKKYVDSLTEVALSRTSTHPLKLNRDSALQKLWQTSVPAERIAIFYDIVAFADELTPVQSLFYHQLILKGAQKRNDKTLEAIVMAELGFITAMNGKTTEGLKMMYRALELGEAAGDAQALGIVYGNLSSCYPDDLQLSNEYVFKALAYSLKANDYTFACLELASLANVFLSINKKDSAISYFLDAYKMAVEKNIESAIPNILLQISSLDNPENGFYYFQQARKMAFTIRNSGMSSTLDRYCFNYYLKSKRMDSAFFYATTYYKSAQLANSRIQLTALNIMHRYYKALPNSDSALYYLEQYYDLKDNMYGIKVIEEAQMMAFNDMQREKELAAARAKYQNKLILYSISTIAFALTVLALVFWRSKKKEEYAKKQVEQTLDKLKSTQSQLVQSEKMASLGELTAGIAHEIQNPLNFVNNFSEVSRELIEELKQERSKPEGIRDKGLEEELMSDIDSNLEKINHHGKRADGIVKGMLQHSRSSTGQKEPTDINALCDEYLRLAYHGLRAKDKTFNAEFKTDFDETIGKINVQPQEMGRVVLNLINNAFFAVSERGKVEGGRNKEEGAPSTSNPTPYTPAVMVTTKKLENSVEIRVKDNGTGIPQHIKEKIFQPFFTTKPTGQGTGLGLSLAYDIVTKVHSGKLVVESEVGRGTTFIATIPT